MKRVLVVVGFVPATAKARSDRHYFLATVTIRPDDSKVVRAHSHNFRSKEAAIKAARRAYATSAVRGAGTIHRKIQSFDSETGRRQAIEALTRRVESMTVKR